MVEEIFNQALSSGLFAALFTFLLFYILKDSSNREKKYIETINKLTKHLDAVIEIKKDVIAVKTKVETLSKVVKGKINAVNDAKAAANSAKVTKEVNLNKLSSEVDDEQV